MADVAEQELVVVGGGPGGYAAAFLAADRGMKVTLVNEAEKPGGTCLHVGCIPSKALLHVARVINEAKEAHKIGVTFAEPKVDVDAVRKNWFKVVDTMATNLAGLCKRRGVQYVSARAKLADGQTLELSDGSRLRFKNCILATGSTPTVPGA